MNVEEAMQFIRQQGWTPQLQKRNKGTLYLYAGRKRKQTLRFRYIGPVSRLEQLTPEDILKKLHQ